MQLDRSLLERNELHEPTALSAFGSELARLDTLDTREGRLKQLIHRTDRLHKEVKLGAEFGDSLCEHCGVGDLSTSNMGNLLLNVRSNTGSKEKRSSVYEERSTQRTYVGRTSSGSILSKKNRSQPLVL